MICYTLIHTHINQVKKEIQKNLINKTEKEGKNTIYNKNDEILDIKYKKLQFLFNNHAIESKEKYKNTNLMKKSKK